MVYAFAKKIMYGGIMEHLWTFDPKIFDTYKHSINIFAPHRVCNCGPEIQGILKILMSTRIT